MILFFVIWLIVSPWSGIVALLPSRSPNTLHFLSGIESLDGKSFRIQAVELSTPVKSPPKTTPRKIEKKPEAIPSERFVIKERRDIAGEIEEYFREDMYAVILYNDPVNKRAFVLSTLMTVFGWAEPRATEVMMTAHTTGAAVATECMKDRAISYVAKLIGFGLVAEARPLKDIS